MKSKIIGYIGVVFIVILVVSTATAIPYIDSQSMKRVFKDLGVRIKTLDFRISLTKFSLLDNTTTLMLAVILITLALICYSNGVLLELFSGMLKPWHVKLFWLGLIFDTSGTILMATLGESSSNSLHMIIGIIALALIIFHNILASIIVKTGNTMFLKCFPKFSLTVYLIWLIAFITGMIIGMKPDHKEDVLGV